MYSVLFILCITLWFQYYAGDSEQQQHFSRQRHSLYNKLSSYFPCHMTQPSQNITDLVRLWAHFIAFYSCKHNATLFPFVLPVLYYNNIHISDHD